MGCCVNRRNSLRESLRTTRYVHVWRKRGISKMLRAVLMQTRSPRDSFCDTVCHAATYNCSLDTMLICNSITCNTWGMTKEVEPQRWKPAFPSAYACHTVPFLLFRVNNWFYRCFCNKYSVFFFATHVHSVTRQLKRRDKRWNLRFHWLRMPWNYSIRWILTTRILPYQAYTVFRILDTLLNFVSSWSQERSTRLVVD